MSYLITGGTGFIGIHIARLLTQEGEEVVTYDIDPRRDILEYLMSKKEIALVKVIKGDITDVAHLIRTAKEHHSTRIIHMAALLSIDSSANPALAVQINCGGTANILETARILRVEKVIYASSNIVFGPAEKYEGSIFPMTFPIIHRLSMVHVSHLSNDWRGTTSMSMEWMV